MKRLARLPQRTWSWVRFPEESVYCCSRSDVNTRISHQYSSSFRGSGCLALKEADLGQEGFRFESLSCTQECEQWCAVSE